MDLVRLVDSLAEAGVKEIQGDLVCNDAHFHGPLHGLGWAWEDLLESYAAPVSALSLNDNLVRMEVSPGPALGAPASVRVMPLQPSDLELRFRVSTGNTNSSAYVDLAHEPGSVAVVVRGAIPLGAPPL